MAIMARKYNGNFCLNLKLNSGDILHYLFFHEIEIRHKGI